MIVAHQYQSGASVEELCRWTLLPRSTYYYRSKQGKKGARPSLTTTKRDGSVVENALVVKDIRSVLSGEFVCYGYQNVTAELKGMDYLINHKKVYRLMNEHHLLLGKVIRTSGKRDFVRFRKIEATRPLEYLCWDIKYVWVKGERRNFYLLSLMDVYTRGILAWIFQGSIKKVDVLKMLERVHLRHDLKGVTLRNDNGSQFIANKVRHHLRSLDVRQEFTHVSTPQENSYIESFHSSLEREVIRRFEFSSYYDAKITISQYMDHYNNRRRHSALKRVAPVVKWNEYYAQVVTENQDTGTALDIDTSSAIFAEVGRNRVERKNYL